MTGALPLAVIRNEPGDTTGIAAAALREAGAGVEVVDAWRGGSLPSPAGLSAVVVLGGVMNVDQTEAHPFLAAERALLREAVAADLPVLGICLGAQVLARALDVPVTRSPVREFGFVPITLTAAGRDDPLLGVFDDGQPLFEWHEDAFDLPPGATLLATGDGAPVQAYRLGRAWGVQFHPEVEADELEAWFEEAGPGLDRAWGRPADSVREEIRRHLPHQQERARELFRRFAGLAAGTGAAGPA